MNVSLYLIFLTTLFLAISICESGRISITSEMEEEFRNDFCATNRKPPKWSYLNSAKAGDQYLINLCISLWKNENLPAPPARSGPKLFKKLSFKHSKNQEDASSSVEECQMDRQIESQLNIVFANKTEQIMVDHIQCRCPNDNRFYVIQKLRSQEYYILEPYADIIDQKATLNYLYSE